jgi:hypothetical protein
MANRLRHPAQERSLSRRASYRRTPGSHERRTDLGGFAHQIIMAVRERFSEAERGRMIGSTKLGRRWRVFREDPSWRKEDGGRENGLVIGWFADPTLDMTSDPVHELLSDVSRLFDFCVLKFQGYLDARRVLLVDQQGELLYMLKGGNRTAPDRTRCWQH